MFGKYSMGAGLHKNSMLAYINEQGLKPFVSANFFVLYTVHMFEPVILFVPHDVSQCVSRRGANPLHEVCILVVDAVDEYIITWFQVVSWRIIP